MGPSVFWLKLIQALMELHWGSGLSGLARKGNKCGAVNEAECKWASTSVIAWDDSEIKIFALLVGITDSRGKSLADNTYLSSPQGILNVMWRTEGSVYWLLHIFQRKKTPNLKSFNQLKPLEMHEREREVLRDTSTNSWVLCLLCAHWPHQYL